MLLQLALFTSLLIDVQQNTWKATIFHSKPTGMTESGGVRVSISQQGSEVLIANGGKVIKGIGIGAVDTCNLSGTDTRGIDSGTIYSAIRSMEVATLGPSEAELTLDRAVATSRAQTMLDIGTAVGAAVALGISVSNASKTTKIALAGVPVVLEFGRVYFTRRLPSDTTTKQYLLRSTGSKPDWVLPPGACIPDGRVFLYRYHGDWNPQEVILP